MLAGLSALVDAGGARRRARLDAARVRARARPRCRRSLDRDAAAAHRRRRRRRLGRAHRAAAHARTRRAGARHAVLADRRPLRGDAAVRRRSPRWRVALAAALLARARSQRCSRAARTSAAALGVAVPQRHAGRARARGRSPPPSRSRLAGSVGFVGLRRAARAAPRRRQRPARAAAGGRARRRHAAGRSPTRWRARSSRPLQLPVGVITALIGVPAVPVPAGARRRAMSTPAALSPAASSPSRSPGARCAAGSISTSRAGECWAIVGPNGAGKTTLLRTLAGLRRPDCGRDRSTTARDSRRSAGASARGAAGYLPQDSVDYFPGDGARDRARRAPSAPRALAVGGARPTSTRARAALADVRPRRPATTATCARCPAASAGASRWRRCWRRTRRCCCSTSRRRTSTSASRSPRSTSLVRHCARERGKALVMVVHDLHLALRYADHAIAIGGGVAPAERRRRR